MQSWTIVSAAGVFAVGWLPALPDSAALLLGAGITAACAAHTRHRALYLPALALLAAGYSALWGQSLLDQRLPAALESIALPATITVLEPPQLRAYPEGRWRRRFAAHVRLQACPETAAPCRKDVGKVLLAYYGDADPRAGEQWRGRLKLKRPRGLANPGSFNYESFLARSRFVATGYVRGTDFERLAAGRAGWVQDWRQLLTDRLREHGLEAPVRAVLLALTTGDRSGMDYELWQRFQRYGINHLVVISGLHVGLVAGVGFLLGLPFGRRTAHVGAAGLAFLYSAAAGFALPTVRALVMLASVQLAAVAGRRVQAWRSLGLALLLIALIDPLATHSAGFWLSFGAVACIFYLQGMHSGVPAWRLTLLIQVGLSLVMGLLASYWFGGFGWLAPLANLVAVPVLSFWLAPLCLVGALVAPVSAALAAHCWDLAAIPVAAFFAADRALYSTGVPLWFDFQPGLASLLGIVAGCLLLLAHPRWPQRWLGVLFFAAALTAAQPRPARGELEAWLLDVGQGLSLVVLAEDFTLVYDTGAGDPAGPNMATGVIAPFLRQRGIHSIDLLVVSHGDLDHAGGVYSLHRGFEVAETWYGETGFPGLPRQRACRAGDRLQYGELDLQVLSPGRHWQTGNDQSCVIRLAHPGVTLLLPGDIGADVEHWLLRRARPALAADILVVPHHGSRSSSVSAFIAAVQPRWALVSRGYRNRFGHPHPDVLARYRHLGFSLCDTAEQGAVQIRVRDGRIEGVQGWRSQKRYYWSGLASPACAPAYNGALEKLR